MSGCKLKEKLTWSQSTSPKISINYKGKNTHLKLVASSKVWHALIVDVLILTPPGRRQVFFHVGAALLIGRVPKVGHTCVQRVSVGGLEMVLGLGCQLGYVAVSPLRLRFLLGLVQKGVWFGCVDRAGERG